MKDPVQVSSTAMVGTIELERIAIRCIVGILPSERVEEQDIFLDVSMDLDFGPASACEDVDKTVDYASLAVALSTLVRDGKFRLIETLAESCAAFVLGEHSAVGKVRVCVHKPAAVRVASDVRVRVERTR